MIKNIPNKYSQPLLLERIDKNHKDTYDFIYLPIDFTVRLEFIKEQMQRRLRIHQLRSRKVHKELLPGVPRQEVGNVQFR